MTSLTNVTEDIIQNYLPPFINLNPRIKIEPEIVDVDDIEGHFKKNVPPLVDDFSIKSFLPVPRYPLFLSWSPHELYFDIDDDVIVKKISIWNECPRIIYVHCGGLWNEAARLGSSWKCYPRTRFHLAPGLKTELNIKATPKFPAPIPSVNATLQLAAAHMRDHIVGVFSVPIIINFLKYKPPRLEEGE